MGGSTRATSSTVTATLDTAWDVPVVVTLPTNAAYSWSADTITVAAGATTGTATLTAVNNFVDAANATVTLTQATYPTDSKWISKGTDVSITINDDDELAKPTGVKLSVDGAKIRVDWAAVTNATGYKVQWSTSSTFATKSEATVSSGSTVTYTINPTPALTANTRYYVRVLPTKSGADEPPSDTVDTATHQTGANATVDYDADNDGLIEITTLAQLNAMRWDLDGNGAVASGDQTNYDTAFPNAEDNMGCNESAVSIASNTGNPACTGYELRANLDFNTNNSAKSSTNPTGADSGDTYWNSGAGWSPIGGATAYTGAFDGNSDTDASGDGGPYKISNLFIAATSGSYFGLFGNVGGTVGISKLTLENASVTRTGSASADVYAGAIAGKSSAPVTSVSSTGQVRAGYDASANDIVFSAASLSTYAGGLVGHFDGTTTTAFDGWSEADVAVYVDGGANATTKAYAGGLAGRAQGAVQASYASGGVSANVTASGHTPTAYAGGLLGELSGGSVKAAYARGGADATATATGGAATPTTHAGGLVGRQAGDLTAVFSTGAATAASTGTSPATNEGGLTGSRASGTTTDAYWDTAASSDSSSASGTGKTTSELQTPTAYGTGSAVYANWDLNLDGQTGNDDPWDFGTASQYPALDYGPIAATGQRPTVTLSVSPSTIWERALNSPSRVNASTVTATLSGKWNEDVLVMLPTNAAYTTSATTITIASGATTGTATLTAVNNFVDAADNAVTLTLATHPTATTWISKGTDVSITINDDDELAKPTGVKLSVDGTKIRVDWTQVTGATGYKVQWNSTSSTSWSSPSEATVSSGSTVNYTVDPTPALTADTRYYVRVVAVKSTGGVDDSAPSDVTDAATTASAGTGDYDVDNDGLIEVSSLAQLNAMRWDLDGNGQVDNATNQSSYDTAFPNAEDNMGCNESVVTIASNTGNPACTGYELRADLDFDTDGDGEADSGDTYWNSGAGWTPIGGATAYTGAFDGNSDTDASGDGGPYKISNLFIAATSGSYFGLFGNVGGTVGVSKLTLENASVTRTGSASASVHAGAIAGKSSAPVTSVSSTGQVRAGYDASANDIVFSAASLSAYAGGLVGHFDGTTTTAFDGWSEADVAVYVDGGANATTKAYAGGLAGRAQGAVQASYASSGVSANVTASGHTPTAYAGGLVGELSGGSVQAAYARGGASAAATATSPGTTPTTHAGGLVGRQAGDLTAVFSTGAATATSTGTSPATNEGGLTGSRASGTTTNSYWDTASSSDSSSASGTGKTTSELQTPTAYGTGSAVYANWDLNLDGVTGNDDPWDFGTASQYPALDYGPIAAAGQRPTVTLSVSPSTIWERALASPSRVNASTVTATLSGKWNEDVLVMLPTNAAYTTSATTITIASGSTTGTATLTAVNNFVDAADNVVTLTLATHPTATTWISKGTDVSITINDDDELAKPTGVKLSVDGTKIRVDWTQVTGATGYKVQWNSTSSTSWSSPSEATVSSGSTVNYTVDPTPALTANTRYYVRVLPTKSGADEPPSDTVDTATHQTGANATVDYDADNDGLIEITTLAQLNAMRWDLDGNGAVASGDQTNYDTAFPNAEDNMGCNESVVSIASNTGNPACTGYELRADLDFNTNNSTKSSTNPTGADSGDTYWNSGAGWTPIGGATAYTGAFDGNADTDASGDGGPYKISNLFIAATSGSYFGLFGNVGGTSGISKLTLENASVTRTGSASASVHAGAIAGKSSAPVTSVSSTGQVRAGYDASANDVVFSAASLSAYAGGLVGHFDGTTTTAFDGWSRAGVTVYVDGGSNATAKAYAGGLAGRAQGAVQASYASGDVGANVTASGNTPTAYAGGLVGELSGGSVQAAYARGGASAAATATSPGTTPTTHAGGLVGRQAGNLTAVFSTGAATATSTGSSASASEGGLTGSRASGTTTNAYWDTQTSGITATGQGTGKTTSQLQTPTAYGTGSAVYANWDLNLDGQTGNDDPWDFGTARQYPALDYGPIAAAGQRVVATLTVSPAGIWESVGTPTTATVTVTLDRAWDKDLTVLLPASASDYTMNPASVTVAAGSTTGTSTVTAVNNRVDAADKSVTLALAANPDSSDRWLSGSTTSPTLAIYDDDELAQVTGVSTAASAAGGIAVSWTKVAGATGYVIEWKSGAQSYTSTRSVTVGDVSTGTIPGASLAVGTTYTVRVYATKSGVDGSPYSAEATHAFKGYLVLTGTTLTDGKHTLSVTEPNSGTATGTYTVKLASQPTANVTVALTRKTGSHPSDPTFSPDSLSFTGTTWSTAQTVTVTVNADVDAGVDDKVIILHTLTSTDSNYGGITAEVTATEDDAETGISLSDFSYGATAYPHKTKLDLTVRNNQGVGVFPVTLPTGVKLYAITVKSLPDAADGVLQWHKQTGPCRLHPTHSSCWSNAAVGDKEFNKHYSARARILNFKPAGTFGGANVNAEFDLVLSASVQPPFNGSEVSANQVTMTLTLATAAPDAPAGLSASFTNGEITLSWTALDQTKTDNKALTRWEYAYSTDDGTTWTSWLHLVGVNRAPGISFYDGFNPQTFPHGETYKFRLRAVNPAGASAASNVSNAVAAPPAAPAGLAATGAAGGVALSWTDPSDSSIVRYQYRHRERSLEPLRADPGSGRAYLAWDDLDTGGATVGKFQYRALSPSGSNNLGTAGGEGSITLFWSPPALTGAYAGKTIQKFQHRERRNIASPFFCWADWADVAGGADVRHVTLDTVRQKRKPGISQSCSITDTLAVDDNDSYRFQVRAAFTDGTFGPLSNEITVTPSAARESGWTDIAPSGAGTRSHEVRGLTDGASYLFQVRPITVQQGRQSFAQWSNLASVTPGTPRYPDWSDIGGSTATTVSHTFTTGLTVGKAYEFQIRARNVAGAGNASPWVSAPPLPAQLSGLAAAPGDGQAALSWTASADPTLVKYQYSKDDGSTWTDVPRSASVRWTAEHVSALTGWQYRHKAGSNAWGSWNTMGDVHANARGYVFNGLDPDLRHRFEMRPVPNNLVPPHTRLSKAGISETLSGSNLTLDWTTWADRCTDGAETCNANRKNGHGATKWQYRYLGTGGWWTGWTDVSGGGSARSATISGQSDGYRYEVRRLPGIGALPVAVGEPVWQSLAASHTVTGLTNGTAYTFKVRAVNAGGDGPASVNFAATPGTSLVAPTLTAAGQGSSVKLDWTSPAANDARGVTGWEYRYKVNTATWVDTWTTVTGADTRTATVSTLTSSTQYDFQVRARNAVGPGPASATATTYAEPRPAKPTGLAASAGHKSVTLSWTGPSTGVSKWQYARTNVHTAGGLSAVGSVGTVRLLWENPDNGFIAFWQYRHKSGGNYGGWRTVPGSNANTTQYAVPGLTAGTSYTFQVRAMRFDIDALPVLRYTQTGPVLGEAAARPLSSLTWEPGAGFGDAATRSRAVSSLVNGSPYTFLLRGLNQYGEPGPASDAVTATPRLAAPTGLAAAGGNTTVTVTWTDPNDSTITRYEYRYTFGSVQCSAGRLAPNRPWHWATVPGSGASTVSHTLTGLANGANVTYCLRRRQCEQRQPGGPDRDRARARPRRPGQPPRDRRRPPDHPLLELRRRLVHQQVGVRALPALRPPLRRPHRHRQRRPRPPRLDEPQRPLHRQVAVPPQVRRQRLPGRLDGHPLEQRQHHQLRGPRPHGRHALHLPGARHEAAPRRAPERRRERRRHRPQQDPHHRGLDAPRERDRGRRLRGAVQLRRRRDVEPLRHRRPHRRRGGPRGLHLLRHPHQRARQGAGALRPRRRRQRLGALGGGRPPRSPLQRLRVLRQRRLHRRLERQYRAALESLRARPPRREQRGRPLLDAGPPRSPPARTGRSPAP